ncbi:hypothetical protein [Actinoplanes sp. NBRC 103695]|uniref:hypothetical protein n=1 Tax=Actinoplanes sp. NBRC 103695 TaxID=3032202 RepID=UPI0024A3EA19|nr:hypothetical protein [Actinoplanes sp. NBRC 103695]GLY97892.1 hypothetical protein Acsp02_51460 [Actinoplanes sp. NBRC 103695]
MRGDLVRILHEATKDDVEYVFGVSKEDGDPDGYDLVVGADGQGSRLRRAVLPPGSPDPYRRVGIHMAYWFVPRIASPTGSSRASRRTPTSGTPTTPPAAG